MGHAWLSCHLLLGGLFSVVSVDASEMDGTRLFTLVLDWEPVVDAGSISCHGGDLDQVGANGVVRSCVFVPDGDGDIIAYVLNIHSVGGIGPLWGLASTVACRCLEFLHS